MVEGMGVEEKGIFGGGEGGGIWGGHVPETLTLPTPLASVLACTAADLYLSHAPLHLTPPPSLNHPLSLSPPPQPPQPQVTRAWCLFEMYTTMKLRGCEMLHLLTPGME